MFCIREYGSFTKRPCAYQCDECREHEDDEIGDRSDLGPGCALWPSSQVPIFLRKDEQPSDLRMI